VLDHPRRVVNCQYRTIAMAKAAFMLLLAELPPVGALKVAPGA